MPCGTFELHGLTDEAVERPGAEAGAGLTKCLSLAPLPSPPPEQGASCVRPKSKHCLSPARRGLRVGRVRTHDEALFSNPATTTDTSSR